MKRILSHIIFVLFLLSIVGAKVLGTTVQAEKIDVKVTGVELFQQVKDLGLLQHKNDKEYNKDHFLSSIETDNGDSSAQDQQDSFVPISILVNVFFSAISLHFIHFAIKRRRKTYEALIQLFDHKYIVYRILRI